MKWNSRIIALLVAAIFIGEAKIVICYETGPYKITDVQMMPCEYQGTNEMNISAKIYRTQNRTHRIFAHRGAMMIPPNVGDYKVTFTCYRKGTDWIIVYSHEDKYCDLIPKFFGELIQALKIYTTCPFPAGYYSYEDWVIELDKSELFPILPYGEYKIRTKLFNTQHELCGCLLMYGNVVKKYPTIFG